MTVLAVLIMMEDQNLSGTSKAVSFSSQETSCWAWHNISTGVWLVSLSNMTWISFPYGHCTAVLATLNCVQFLRFLSCWNEIKLNKGSCLITCFVGWNSLQVLWLVCKWPLPIPVHFVTVHSWHTQSSSTLFGHDSKTLSSEDKTRAG